MPGVRGRTSSIVAIFILCLHAASALAASEDERRVKTGARVFRGLLSADLEIDEKVDEDGNLTVLVVGDGSSYTELATSIIAPETEEGAAKVKGYPLRARVVDVDTLASIEMANIGGIFLAARVRAQELDVVIDFASSRRVIAFSPFEGDVEQGMAGGLSIEARVKPYVNQQALARAGVQLKDIFLKASKLYR